MLMLDVGFGDGGFDPPLPLPPPPQAVSATAVKAAMSQALA
ncbi:MAG TPA: hypothetical protein VFE79_25425 [Paraburkholderia sp.]|nr:hypothetical protein [Paraburkholderia sp.]